VYYGSLHQEEVAVHTEDEGEDLQDIKAEGHQSTEHAEGGVEHHEMENLVKNFRYSGGEDTMGEGKEEDGPENLEKYRTPMGGGK